MGRPSDKRLIKSVQQATDVRLVLPFGLNLVVGDVVSIDKKDGNLTLEGSTRSLLRMEPGTPRTPAPPGDSWWLHGKGSQCTFRGAGTASALFAGAADASAGFDIHFDSAQSWLLATRKRQLASLDEVHRYRAPILAAFHRNVWKPDWALVTEVATADRVTLLASRMANTNVALSLGANVAANAATEVKLTADVSVSNTNQQLTQWIRSEPAVMGFRGLRVRDPWWRSAYVDTLKPGEEPAGDVQTASDEDFWEDADDFWLDTDS
jgi:hypothetical protein